MQNLTFMRVEGHFALPFLFFLMCLSTLTLGCRNNDTELSKAEEIPLLPPNEFLTAEDQARIQKGRQYVHKYQQLKEKEPDEALAALKKGAELLHNGHPKSHLWAEMIFTMDRIGKATFLQIIAFDKLMLEIATDLNHSKAVIERYERAIKENEALIEELKAEGQDPDEITFDFQFNPEGDPAK